MVMQMDGLPSAYSKVSYIGSTDDTGQYIDTGVDVSDTIVVKIKWAFSILRSWQSVFGGRGATFSIQRYAVSQTINAQSYGKTNGVLTGYVAGDVIISELSKTKCIINGTTTLINSGSLEYPQNTIWIFGKQNASATGIDIKGACDIYYCQIYDGDALVRNMIPCVRKSDSKPGMYDTVSKTFYTNAGTGEFIVPA